MKDFFFDNDSGKDDVGQFIASLGDAATAVLEDLVIIARHDPALMNCTQLAGGIWEYQHSLGQGRRVIILFDFVDSCDAYIGLHGFRAGPEGTKREDLRLARKRRRKYPR